MNRKKVYIIGAGQLGSRHLQALKGVGIPLTITVIDPSSASLATAKERYKTYEVSEVLNHEVTFSQTIPASKDAVDLVIIPTNSNVRRKVIEEVLKGNAVRYFILEKLLFQNFTDYSDVANLLKQNTSTAWVNCSMRTMPYYQKLRAHFHDRPLTYSVTGSQYGLITNAIHYLDHVAYLTGSTDFFVNTDYLDPNPIASKRAGFLELNGTLLAKYKNGSMAMLTCYPEGDAPVTVEIFNETYRCISRESEKTAWVSSQSAKWLWTEESTNLPYQSAMTTKVVEEILEKGSCPLTPYSESVAIHKQLLPPLLEFLKKKSEKNYDYYPFT
ncbi:MAG: Gfo/Idh/MocA family oxidoreductase [Patescibacteria group bacterium]|jgi:predicted dehydrogenase